MANERFVTLMSGLDIELAQKLLFLLGSRTALLTVSAVSLEISQGSLCNVLFCGMTNVMNWREELVGLTSDLN